MNHDDDLGSWQRLGTVAAALVDRLSKQRGRPDLIETIEQAVEHISKTPEH